MKRWLLFGAMALAVVTTAPGQPAQFWINDGVITAPPDIAPQVDALNFVNNGTITINFNGFDYLPLFDSSDTLNFTNNGFMSSSTGFRFDTEPVEHGVATWAANFDNKGVIESGLNSTTLGGIIFFNFLAVNGARTLVNATNIVSPGTFNQGFESLLSFNGSDVNLSRSLVTMQNSGLTLNSLNFFFNSGILDGYWGIGTNTIFPRQFEFPQPFSPGVTATDRNNGFVFQQLGGPGTQSYFKVDDTSLIDSNRVVRAAFVNSTNTDFDVKVYFLSQNDPFFFLGDIAVQLTSHPTNNFGEVSTNFIYVFDSFLIYTNLQLLLDGTAGFRPTFIPANYSFFLSGPLGITTPPTGASVIPPGTFNPPPAPFTSTNDYTAYEALFLPTTRVLSDIPSQNVTNLPGRVEIRASDYLDLSLARIAADNYMLISATNQFAGSDGSLLSAPFFDLNLRSTNGFLNITNVVVPTVPKPEGTIELQSQRWTNVVNGVTNLYHVLFLDAKLIASLPTREQDVILRSTNTLGGDDSIVIHDVLNVTHSLLLDSSRLTIETNAPGSVPPTGEINFLSTSILWSTTTPRLQYLTNHGVLTAGNAVFFGGSRSSPFYNSTFDEPYQVFINTGSVTNMGSLIWANLFENSGIFDAQVGAINLQSYFSILTNGAFLATNNAISITANSLLVSNHVLNAGLAITLSTPNIDDGSLAFNSADYVTNKNIWNAQGFNLLTPPTLASLLATSVTNTAPAFRNVINRWAAADRGATPDGFYNNAAVGRIVLNGSTNTLFTFQGTSVNNALYVDSLEFENGATNQNVAGDYTEVSIAPNMRIYYAQATAGGVSVAEKLDGRNNGRFRWVSNYNCGFFSSTNLVYPDGSTNRVNAALAQSCNIDSDGDGTVNCVDLSPIPPASLGTCAAPTGLAIPTTLPPPPVVISGSPGSTNRTGVPKLDFPGAGYGSGSGSFAPAKGSYSGLFYETNGVTVSSAGWFAATTTGRGAYTARIMMGGRSYSLSGHFDTNGLASGKLMRGALHSLNVQLQVDPATDQIHGQITDGHWTAEALADRLVFNSLKHSAGAYAGSYTVFIPGNSPGTGNPEGAGFGTVKVDASGGVQFAASLADGTKVTQKSSLSSSGIWPLYVSLYGGRGCALSWMQFTNSALGGQLAWIKPAGAPGKNYGAGFTNEVLTTGLSYHKPAAGARVLDWSGGLGDLILSGGSLSDSVTNAIRLELNNKVTNLSPGKLTLNITTSSGLFKGSFLDTLTGKTIQFQGALFDDWNMGFGFFLDSSKSGQVFLGPAVP